MKETTYQLHFEAEDNQWWFSTRRKIFSNVISRVLNPQAKLEIMEYGCGSGGNYKILSHFGDVVGVDMSDTALSFAQTRGMNKVAKIDEIEETPKGPFDLIACLDVLEHIPDDLQSLRILHERIKPGWFSTYKRACI